MLNANGLGVKEALISDDPFPLLGVKEALISDDPFPLPFLVLLLVILLLIVGASP